MIRLKLQRLLHRSGKLSVPLSKCIMYHIKGIISTVGIILKNSGNMMCMVILNLAKRTQLIVE